MEKFQNVYYKEVASKYDEMHIGDIHNEHYRAIKHIVGFSKTLGLRSFLDVGCGTGRGVVEIASHGFDVTGIDPSPDMLKKAQQKAPMNKLVLGEGEKIPFGDHAFDGVYELGMLHHVRNPGKVVEEMLRVSKKAIFLSDANRFGQGGFVQKIIKLALYKTGLWPVANWIKTKGKGYIITEGDGLSYSYSVYDSFDRIKSWADQLYLLPTCTTTCDGWVSPLLTSGHVLLVAYKDD